MPSSGRRARVPKPDMPPAQPWLARLGSSSVMVASLVVLIAIMAVSAVVLKPQFDNPKIVLAEAPLIKNTGFQLTSGEQYTYAYLLNGTQTNVTYEIMSGGNCTIIAFMETDPPSTSCVDRWGMDARGYNSLLENPQMILFQPWMLALREGWKWNTTMYMAFANESQYVAGMDYRVVRTDTWHGREAFVVMENVSGSEPEYDWVDAEKRILLSQQGNGYEIDLVGGLNESG